MKSQKFCFSYIRYSSKGQIGNTSVDRQSEVAPRVAEKMGWVLRTDLAILQEAVSAYKGLNVPMIKRIIQDVTDGTIPKGTVMIIEKFNRAFRQNLEDSMPLLWDILKSGLELYIDQTGRHLTRDSLNNESEMMMALFELKAAFKHSNDLSDQVRKALKIKREEVLNGEAKGVSSNVPGWIAVNQIVVRQKPVIQGYELNDKANTVKRIFRQYLKGIGVGQIVRELNREQVKTLGERKRFGKETKWGAAVVARLLSNPQVIGEHSVNGQKVKGFFPAAVTEETFLRVQTKINDNKGKCSATKGEEGKEHSIRSIFKGVAFCSHCGRSIRVTKGKVQNYITCWGHEAGICDAPTARYNDLENAFGSLLRLHPEHFLKDESGDSISTQVQILNGRLVENQKEIQSMLELQKEAKEQGLTVKSVIMELAKLETKADEIKRQIDLERAKTVSVKGSSKRLQEITEQLKNLSTDKEIRLMAQGWIRENINRIDLNRVDKTFTMDLKTGNVLKMGLDGFVIECKSFVSLFTGNKVQDKAASVG